MPEKTSKNYFYGLGRRKESTARARVTKGKGNIVVNKQSAQEYFAKNEKLLEELVEPLKLVAKENSVDVSLLVKGGGHSGQVGAAKLAIAKAISEMNEDLRSTLKKAGLLKRDPREKERKKYGLRRARKKEQFSKR